MVYDSYEFGKYLTELRRKYNVSMNVVCDGICDQSVMSRIENGEREVSKLVQDRLLGRLGVAPENFENMVYADEYGYWKTRQEIISLIQHEKMDEADKLLEQAEQLTTNMKHMSTTDRTLTLGLPAMSGSLVFTDLLRTLYARSPGTHIQVMENGSLANRSKIMDHTLDAAIITRNGPLPPGIGHVTLRHVNVCLYLSVMHPLAEKDTVTTDDLDQLPLAMLHQYYETLHLKPSIIVRTNQLATIQQLVATNTTAAFLLDHVLEESSDIVKRTVPGLLPAEIDLIWKSSRHLSPHLKNLITAARNI